MRMIRDLKAMEPCVLVLGMFDGVHRGHQALLKAGRKRADAWGLPLCVCTFEPHPMAVLRPERKLQRLTTPTERACLMAHYGVDILSVCSFTAALAAQEPEAYVANLVRIYQPRAIVTGFNFTFGNGGSGNCCTLEQLSARYGYESITVPEVVLGGATVSSTRIRAMLACGELEEAEALMNHPYTLAGYVTDGKHIGRTMGFPTANVTVPRGKALPAYGVYTCLMRAEGKLWTAVVNVGRHPTLPEGHVTVEAHVIDCALNLYGKRVQLIFLSFRRPEQTFADVEALQQRIQADVADARQYFAAWQHKSSVRKRRNRAEKQK